MGPGGISQVNEFEHICSGHTGTLPSEQTDTTKNITFPQPRWPAGKKLLFEGRISLWISAPDESILDGCSHCPSYTEATPCTANKDSFVFWISPDKKIFPTCGYSEPGSMVINLWHIPFEDMCTVRYLRSKTSQYLSKLMTYVHHCLQVSSLSASARLIINYSYCDKFSNLFVTLVFVTNR